MEQAVINRRELPGEVQNYISTLEEKNNSLECQNTTLEELIEQLEEKLRLALFRKFSRSSEKLDTSQLDFFEIPEDTEEQEKSEELTITVPSHTRKKKGRKPLDPSLPRKIIVHNIDEADKECACGHALVKVDEEITERLQIIPEQVYVERHIRPKYACRHCEGSGDEEHPVFRIAPSPPTLIPGSIVTHGLLAFIFVNKFCDHLPFYRQEKRFERLGAHISRQNMSNWAFKVYEALGPLENLLEQEVKSGPYIQMDETPVQVLSEPDRPATSKSYMWLARGGPPKTPIVYYKYQETRKSQFVKDFLEDYAGFLQSDGYKGYETALKENSDVIHVGCLAHAKRKFHDAAQASKKAGSATIALVKIKAFYRVEKELRNLNLPEDEFVERRKKEIEPITKDFKSWLDDKALKIRPESETGKAVAYTLGQWKKIMRYLDCAELTPDNNAAERSIKPFVIGPKNWLFSGSPGGANASALLFSLIETAKANDLNPYGYLKWIIEQIPLLKSEDDFKKLLPGNCDREEVNRIQFHGLQN